MSDFIADIIIHFLDGNLQHSTTLIIAKSIQISGKKY